MADTNTLSITPREARLKKNRRLRAEGLVPGVIYGHRVDPLAVSLPRRDFERAFHKVGRTQLLDLNVEGENKPRRVLVREVQYEPRTGLTVHIDFYQVNLKEKIAADVPVVLVGEAPAVQLREGELLQTLHTVKVSCLPADIPEHIEVDVSSLMAVDDAVHVNELKIPEGIELLNDGEDLVVKIAAMRVIEVEAPVEPAEGEAVEGEAEGEPAEGAATGEASSEES